MNSCPKRPSPRRFDILLSLISIGLPFSSDLGAYESGSSAPPPAAGVVYYISPSGSDSNSGSSNSPWKTLRKAAATLMPGETAIAMDGTYEEPEILFQRSGTESLRITIKAQNKHRAIVSSISNCAPNISLYASYITIEDLRISISPRNPTCPSPSTTTGDGVRCWPSGEPKLGGQTSSGFVGCIVRGVRIDPSPIRGEGVKTNQDDSIVENSEIYSGIEALNTSGTIFRNNVIIGGDRWGNGIVSKGGLRNFQAYGNVVRFNASWGSGIIMGGATGTQWVFDPATGLEAYNAVAYNNVVIDETDGTGIALNMRGAKDSAFFNNVVINGNISVSNGYSTTASVNPTFKNNIVVCGGKKAAGTLNYTGTLTVDYNDFYNCSGVPPQSHPINGDPLFVSQASDWHLRSASPAIGSGASLNFPAYGGGTIDVSKDFAGAARSVPWDLGIYDIGATSPPPAAPAPNSIAISVPMGSILPDTGTTAVVITFSTGTPGSVTLARGTTAQFAQWPTGNLSQYFTRTVTGLSFDLCLTSACGVNPGSLILQAAGSYPTGSPASANASTTVTIQSSAPQPLSSPTDLNGDGVTDIVDVQIGVNQALGSAACGTGDIDNNGACSVADIQKIINKTLGL